MTSLDHIDAILYINLDHRTDRNQHVMDEIKKIDPTLSKTHRISAEYVPTLGSLGCSLSHIKALQLFMEHPEWNTCIILEDDFTFVSASANEINEQILTLYNSQTTFDVLLLAYSIHNFRYNPTSSPLIHHVMDAQTTSGYMVHKKYAPILLQNFIEGSELLRAHGKSSNVGCIDVYWKKLIPSGNWYAYHNHIGYQYPNFSDIEHRETDYKC
jgi:GR25 family glycosyltransferase involved in LPS biosynthesis